MAVWQRGCWSSKVSRSAGVSMSKAKQLPGTILGVRPLAKAASAWGLKLLPSKMNSMALGGLQIMPLVPIFSAVGSDQGVYFFRGDAGYVRGHNKNAPRVEVFEQVICRLG